MVGSVFRQIEAQHLHQTLEWLDWWSGSHRRTLRHSPLARSAAPRADRQLMRSRQLSRPGPLQSPTGRRHHSSSAHQRRPWQIASPARQIYSNLQITTRPPRGARWRIVDIEPSSPRLGVSDMHACLVAPSRNSSQSAANSLANSRQTCLTCSHHGQMRSCTENAYASHSLVCVALSLRALGLCPAPRSSLAHSPSSASHSHLHTFLTRADVTSRGRATAAAHLPRL